ncbi:hypothetical protein [Micromonospora sp. DPT]|uniref:hypothetical protein n=1 Tax=Micromonospora sp. DPT TaxID=3142975 RepID=UPI00320A8242
MLVTMAYSRPITLATAVVLALSLTACGSDAPTREEAGREAGSGAVRQASASVAARFDEILTGLAKRSPALRPVATPVSDACHAGKTNGFFPHDPYRLTCSRGETRYFGARGELLDGLRQVDAWAKRAGLMTVSGESLEDVEVNLAADGETGDAHPRLTYLAPGVRRSALRRVVTGGRLEAPRISRGTPVADGFPGGPPGRRRSAAERSPAGQKYLITVTSVVTYHEVPWDG